MTASNAAPFLAARDFLLRHREDYETAYREFRWPKLDRFNWALDYFDVMARDNAQPALWLVDEDAGETKLSFAELSERSNRVANAFRRLGVRRGDRVLLMLGNVVPLWECMLAAMKLGAVIVPATTLLDAQRSRRPFRARPRQARHRRRRCGGEIRRLAGRLHADRRRQGGAGLGFVTRTVTRQSADFTPDGETRADDPLLLYFTSGTTATPKLVLHSHQSYPVGHLSTIYWLGLRPGDLHLNISSPGWAKHAWSCFFSPWTAQAAIFIVNQRRFNARGLARHDRALRRHHVLRAAYGLAHADPGGSVGLESPAERADRRRRAAQSGSHRTGADSLGSDHPRRLRPDRDHGAGRQHAGAKAQTRLDGPAASGLSRRASGSAVVLRATGGRDLSHAGAAADRTHARLSGRRRQPRSPAGKLRCTAPATSPPSTMTVI